MRTLFNILSIVVALIVLVGAMSCSRPEKYKVKEMFASVVELDSATLAKLCADFKEREAPIKSKIYGDLEIKEIDGHEYVIYNNGQFGNSMVHHAGCNHGF